MRTSMGPVITAFIITIFISGCATTRVVKKQPNVGGVIMVQEGIYGNARADADKIMRENCGRKKPVILEEGEAVVGTSTRGSEHTGKNSKSVNASTVDAREWRITYKCK